ncbi:YgjV family protein [Rhodovastum atsumiense]|uniref:YgjV family protein n=1 Tax=Rhodovastum atsumiense TaxID=504468 RepID=A0A5M6J3U8_9PROT|nr:YgjV family protein [Rhodovastum atsumiense]KAA5614288.1 YgjV family protein [Rhodovastum atsumiense]CAH2604745.1 YgjV family protein [Rhodovastum atsumiense]
MDGFQPFSTTQCVGYVALALGVAAFLQKRDVSLKLLNGTQNIAYALHFVLLGNMAAGTSAFVSAARSLLAARFRAPWLAGVFIALNLALGLPVLQSPFGLVPIIAGCSATAAVFLLQGVKLRLVLLGCTMAWLVNNIVSGSIGGTVLEAFVAVANTTTIIRLLRG